MFDKNESARADLKPGTVYAISGPNSEIYYGQIANDKSVGFFDLVTINIETPNTIGLKIKTIIGVGHPSIGLALREGYWKKIGRYPLNPELVDYPLLVLWPTHSINVEVWKGPIIVKRTTAFDSEIQELQIMSSWDAIYHIPERLQFEFFPDKSNAIIGGPIKRERIIREKLAEDFPNWHSLPEGWIYMPKT